MIPRGDVNLARLAAICIGHVIDLSLPALILGPISKEPVSVVAIPLNAIETFASSRTMTPQLHYLLLQLANLKLH